MPNLQLGRESSEKYPGAYAEGDVCCPMEVTGSHCMHVTALGGLAHDLMRVALPPSTTDTQLFMEAQPCAISTHLQFCSIQPIPSDCEAQNLGSVFSCHVKTFALGESSRKGHKETK